MLQAAAGACAYTRSPGGGAHYPGPLSGAGLGLSGAVRAAAGPCVTQGLANDGALLMPGTGAKHLAGGQPPIGRALHDFGCPDGASEFSARFEEHHCIFRPATAWQAPGTCIGFANPYPLAKLGSRGITLHAVNSPAANVQALEWKRARRLESVGKLQFQTAAHWQHILQQHSQRQHGAASCASRSNHWFAHQHRHRPRRAAQQCDTAFGCKPFAISTRA